MLMRGGEDDKCIIIKGHCSRYLLPFMWRDWSPVAYLYVSKPNLLCSNTFPNMSCRFDNEISAEFYFYRLQIFVLFYLFVFNNFL